MVGDSKALDKKFRELESDATSKIQNMKNELLERMEQLYATFGVSIFINIDSEFCEPNKTQQFGTSVIKPEDDFLEIELYCLK